MRLLPLIEYDGGMLTKWQLFGVFVIVVGFGLMSAPVLSFKAGSLRRMMSPPAPVVAAGIAVASIGGLIVWKTRNAH